MSERGFLDRLRAGIAFGAARLRHERPQASARMLVVAGHVPAATLPHGRVSRAPHSWLDDARRLRPHLAPQAREFASASAPELSQERDASQLHVGARAARSAEEHTTLPASPRLKDLAVRQPVPPAAGDTSRAEGLEALDGLDAVQRRLVVVRYLVRQGLYNEGFAQENVPAQYRWHDEHEPS